MIKTQELIVLAIVLIAVVIAGYKVYKHLASPLKGCSGCASDCSGCQLQDLKKEIEANQNRKTG
jgi:hypothetical protein